MPTAVLDSACASAVDLARAAAEEDAGGPVGDHLEVVADGERVATHYFASVSPAYVGWRWAVTVARASRAKAVTIDEVVLVAGPESVVAPPWVPWRDRVQPGDLSAGDLLPHRAEDPFLSPGYTGAADADAADPDAVLAPLGWEAGLGRPRVLSPLGREDAGDRWSAGEFGPGAATAALAPGQCSSCGYLLTIGGPLGQAFGICAQPLSPADGRVVTLDFGCGAHSEATAVVEPEPVVGEESALELVDLAAYEPPVVVEEADAVDLDVVDLAAAAGADALAASADAAALLAPAGEAPAASAEEEDAEQADDDAEAAAEQHDGAVVRIEEAVAAEQHDQPGDEAPESADGHDGDAVLP